MAVQYNSKDSWSGIVVDLLKAKKGIVEVSDEATKFFEKYQKNGKNLSATIENVSKSNGFKGFIKDSKLADESLISFLKNGDYAEKTLENFQLYLKNTTKPLNFFQRAIKTAGSALKTLMATLGSMAVVLAAVAVFKLAAHIVDKVIVTMDELNEKIEENRELYKETAKEIDSLNSELENTKERIDELNALDKLSFTEKDELNNLKEQNAELEKKYKVK